MGKDHRRLRGVVGRLRPLVQDAFFGEAIEQSEATSASTENHPGPRNLLAMLPERFTRAQALAVRQQMGKSDNGLSAMLSNWKKRGFIEADADGNYVRTVKGLEHLGAGSFISRG